jgi:hypothetical protein
MSTTLTDLDNVEVDLEEENRFAHYAEKVSVTEGYVLGTPVLAVCGKLFIPSRDPKKFPLCPICKKISEALFLPNIN